MIVGGQDKYFQCCATYDSITSPDLHIHECNCGNEFHTEGFDRKLGWHGRGSAVKTFPHSLFPNTHVIL